MNKAKKVKLFYIEKYFRDRKRDGLYSAFEYIGDSISTQDLIMVEQDVRYRAYLVNTILDEVKTWADSELDNFILSLGE